jgi:hypothetical protein
LQDLGCDFMVLQNVLVDRSDQLREWYLGLLLVKGANLVCSREKLHQRPLDQAGLSNLLLLDFLNMVDQNEKFLGEFLSVIGKFLGNRGRRTQCSASSFSTHFTSGIVTPRASG